MKRGLIIIASIVGVAVGALGIYHGTVHNEIDPGYVLAAVGFSFTASSALILYVNNSINKRIDDLRDDVKCKGPSYLVE